MHRPPFGRSARKAGIKRSMTVICEIDVEKLVPRIKGRTGIHNFPNILVLILTSP